MSFNSYKNLDVSTKERICFIAFSRPEKRNAWNEHMRTELVHALDAANRNEDVRAIILTGNPAGRAFCAGADLTSGSNFGEEFSKMGKKYDVAPGRKVDNGTFRDGGGVGALAILRSTKPVICAINGPAVGVGMTIACACDMRVAPLDTKVGFVFVRRGLAVETCSSLLLPRLVGMGKAMELVLTGRVFKTQQGEYVVVFIAGYYSDRLIKSSP
mmetsp:Transcript_11337/g.18473  ORF Transcript_11337/g.18473 Transcript_11337/m.18473 type:complete len:214 (-) Transcript_11337:1104-1745(-)